MSNNHHPTEVYAWEGPPRISVRTEQVEHNGNHWLQHVVKATEGSDGVVVVAVLENKILLVRHFRPVTRSTLLEFPRGFGRSSQDDVPVEDHACREAKRELQEETALTGRASRFLGYVWPDSGILGDRVAVVQVEVLPVSPSKDLDGEIDSMHWASPQDMSNLISTGQICDGITLAAYAMWCAFTGKLLTVSCTKTSRW